ncbi:MAG: CapA family protein, partial [Bacteroidota bacterium]
TQTAEPSPEPTMYSIIGVGDMMLGTNYPSTNYLPPSGGSTMLADMEDILQNADVTFGNLEGTLLDKGGTVKNCKDPSVCYAFRSPESYGKHFQKAGFDFLSLANNHVGDFGPTGRTTTKSVLDELDIAYAGLAGTDEWAVIERNGVKYGMAAFSPNRGTCNIRSISRAKEIVRQLHEKCDIVIVSFHGGAEGAKNQRVTKATEYYYGEDRGNVHAFSHAVIDAGADVVFGHGPHVTRSMELYKGRIIAYSLGNFCTYGRFNLRGPAGIAPLLKVFVDPEGKFLHGEIISTYQMKSHGPKIDAENRALKKLQELTKLDFPNGQLHFAEDGTVVPINK